MSLRRCGLLSDRGCEIITVPYRPIGTGPVRRAVHERLPGDRRRRHQHYVLGEAAADAIKTAGQSVRDLRVAEVVKQDIHVGDGSELIYRTKIQLSFKYEQES